MDDGAHASQEHQPPGSYPNSAETWGNPSGTASNPLPENRPNNPSGQSGQPSGDRRRRLEIDIDGHFELALYISPRLLRWFSGICVTAASASWYIVTH
ncbi:hypothetical protein [Streptomyces sp. NPDC058989]|uniref:hypothetical protein n=1 Tax=Streptomyces sp. NPDC058989 TaxID=3346686 RepID=UPI0036C929C9